MSESFYASTKKRLEQYGIFSPDVADSVAQFAQKQRAFPTYQEFFLAMGVGKVATHVLPNGNGVTVVDIPAKKKQQGVIVVHAAMSTPLNANQLYALATIAGVNPEYRIVGFGNPVTGAHYQRSQGLRAIDWVKIAVANDLGPIVELELDYLRTQGIDTCYQVGYSYGALKAVAESQYLGEGHLKGLLLVDPVAFPRSVIRLARDFKKTYGPLGEYVNRVNVPTYHAARGDAAKEQGNGPIGRPVSIAIGLALARINIYKRLRNIIEYTPKAKVAVAWATQSELGDDSVTRDFIDSTAPHAIHAMRVENEAHAFANDVHLYAALVRQFITKA